MVGNMKRGVPENGALKQGREREFARRVSLTRCRSQIRRINIFAFARKGGRIEVGKKEETTEWR